MSDSSSRICQNRLGGKFPQWFKKEVQNTCDVKIFSITWILKHGLPVFFFVFFPPEAQDFWNSLVAPQLGTPSEDA